MANTDWPEELELTLDGIAQGGEGVGRWQERVVFAGGGLPGEQVRVQIQEAHPNYARGRVIEIQEAAPERVPPRMPGADHIAWQHIDYAAQLRYKRQILAEQLSKIGGLEGVEVDQTQPASAPWNYRNTARLHSDGRRVGYYAAETRELQAIDSDPLLLPALNQALAELPAALQEDTPEDGLEILLRASESYHYALATLRGTGDLRYTGSHWRGRAAVLAGVMVGPQPTAMLGADSLVEELGNIQFQLRPETFFQVNLASAEALLGLARAGLALQGGERLLDLYCGAGAFALPLARQVSEVIGVEAGYTAVEDAKLSAALNGISNAHFLAGQVERVLEQTRSHFDAVVLDPPRRGCHPEALAALVRLAAQRIVYISCQPATLARDLKQLVAGGYRLVRVTPVDLFPQTPHIESVSVLERVG